MRRRRQRRRSEAAVIGALPESIELLIVALRAGATPEFAVRRLATLLEEPIGPALGEVVRRVDAGDRFADALESLTATAGEATRPLVRAITASERYGLPLVPALERVTFEARAIRRRRNETAIRQLPVKLAFPLVGCVLPAFAVLTIVPALIGALGALQP